MTNTETTYLHIYLHVSLCHVFHQGLHQNNTFLQINIDNENQFILIHQYPTTIWEKTYQATAERHQSSITVSLAL